MRGKKIIFCHWFLQLHASGYYKLLFSRTRFYVLDIFTAIATQLKHHGLCGTKGRTVVVKTYLHLIPGLDLVF